MSKNKNNIYQEKRASLENYVTEQIIGPGAYHNRYFLLKDELWNNHEFNQKNIVECKAIYNVSELITEVPAYQYSSGILFPTVKQKIEDNVAEEVENDVEENDVEENENAEDNKGVDDDEIKESKEENVTLKQQNYPSSFGLTFVVDKQINIQEDIKVTFNARYYKKLKTDDLLNNQFGVFIPEYQQEITDAIETYFNTYFKIVKKEGNSFAIVLKKLEKEDGYSVDYGGLSDFSKDNILKEINKLDRVEKVNEKNNTTYYGVRINDNYAPQFYSLSDVKHGHNDVYTIFDKSLSSYIIGELEKDHNNYKKYKNIIQQLEVYKQLKELIKNLRSGVEVKKHPTPIWQSHLVHAEINLPNIDANKSVQRFDSQNLSFDDDNEELLNKITYTAQYIRKNNKVYIKLIVSNNNVFNLSANEVPQLNKKDGVNKITLFGVELSIQETKESVLLNYNPPQMLQGDDEDNFNKLLYRNFNDLGEGYNTSVNWGKYQDNLSFIATDFLPSEETPTVDYTPSKINDEKGIVEPLINKKTLHMRHLSTLSDVDDKAVINTLNNFVDAYKVWIDKKRADLIEERENNTELNSELLTTELNACKKDYRRLKRNIGLLEKDPNAMTAFRTMNTAMFMQLHHSIETKKAKKTNTTFDPDNNEESFYKEIDLGENEYGWRSFQLAFVLLNIDAFVKPKENDDTVEDVFGTGWPERNEIADLVWFPTGGGKTEAYLGIIAFTIAYRRFTKGEKAGGTAVLMRYTLRMLTLQQFQRATLLILALETIRKNDFELPNNNQLGEERITIGLFVGGDSLPNSWASKNNDGQDGSMISELIKIAEAIENNKKIETKIPFTQCPWCASDLFQTEELNNISPNHNTKDGNTYGINTQLNISCNNDKCTFHGKRPRPNKSLPLQLFDEDIYKYPPTLLFGTVDKFAALANKVSNDTGDRNQDSKRLLGKGYQLNNLPPELIIQDELHLLLGPLGSAVGLYEKGIDYLCSYKNDEGSTVQPKVITSTATTRNTDKQIFALFNRRTEIFPKQGILCDDSFFSFYKRQKGNVNKYEAQRRYVGVLPTGKTQTWMQLRIISICLAHRLKYFKDKYTLSSVFENPDTLKELEKVFDYYHTILSYYNSLKDVGKAQSQLDHYLPGDLNYVIQNTIGWSFIDKIIRSNTISDSELTGRLSGEEVKTNLSDIERTWSLLNENNTLKIKKNQPPEFVISTNMISVGIDVSRFNTIIMNSMPRNIAEYIQASSRVARDKDGIVFTVHHPFRSRDISHYQKFKEFHEKFYSYVEPISVTPFASKALDRYLALFTALIVRHKTDLTNNKQANDYNNDIAEKVTNLVMDEIKKIKKNAESLEKHLSTKGKDDHLISTIDGIISEEEITDIEDKLESLFKIWHDRINGIDETSNLSYRIYGNENESLFKDLKSENHWKVTQSLREIGETSVIKTVQQ